MTSRAAQRTRGVLAALALLAFIAGIPSGLLALGASPARLIPDHWPGPGSIGQWPERIWNALRWAWLTGDLVIWLIVAVAWAGWLALAVSVAVEVIRQTGHSVRAARGLLGRVPRGRWIAGLVAAVLMAASAGTATASGAPAAPVAATAPPWPHTHSGTAAPEPRVPSAADTANAASAAQRAHLVPYTVVHGDTLWGLATRHLGTGIRYHEIVQLNPTLVGKAPDDLKPGWTLLLPPDAVGLPHPADIAAATGRTVIVKPADTLSGIAERELGDPDAWPALFDLNAGRTQPDGRALRHPDQLLPGWTVVLPGETATPPSPAPPSISSPTPGSMPSKVSPAPGERAAPQARHGAEQHPPAAGPETGISLSTGAFVGLGLAALITIAMITVRLRRRRCYQPGSPERPDPAGLPVVRALRLAHDTATRASDDDAMPVAARALPGRARPAETDARDRARTLLPLSPDTPLGVRDGQAIALDLARTQGLGLVGPGAHAAARALIVTVLAQATSDSLDATIVILAADAHALFGSDLPDRVPERLHVVDDMPAALDILEGELLTRTHADDARHGNGPLLVVATPAGDTDRRARAILENGSPLGLAGVFLGPWRSGATARVRADGIAEATSAPFPDDLAGARLFTLPDTDAIDLFALLREAGPSGDELPPHQAPAGNPAIQRPRPTVKAEQLIGTYEFINAVPGIASGTSTEPVQAPALGVADSPSQDTATRLLVAAETGVGGDTSNDPDDPIAPHALGGDARVVTEHPHAGSAAAVPLHLQVLGRLHLTRAAPEPLDVIDAFAPRQREILVYLALHRAGCRRETLTATLWPDAPGDRPYNTFHATLSQLRASLRRAVDDTCTIIVNQDGYYGLDRTGVTVDLWQLQDALAAGRRQGSPAEISGALNRVTELYHGDLAEGIRAEWIEGPREALRRDVLDAFSTLIRKIRNDDPEQALALLEQARQLDPYNEAIYRDLMRMQARLGQHDSIPRTLSLLTTSLSDLDQRPARDTLSLADALQQSRNQTRHSRAS